MADKKHTLTYAGFKRHEDELQNLKIVKRKKVAQRIEEAGEQGDLSENTGHDTAKDEQRDIELRIEESEKLLKNAEVAVEDETDLDKINIRCKVKLLDAGYDEETESYTVSSAEVNSLQNEVSSESPVDCALIGKVVGDCVDVETQVEGIQYKALETQRVS